MNSPRANIGEALHEATTLQQQGRLREAEKIYTRVLKAVPDQFDALHLLGTIKAQTGHAGEAHRLITRALKINPDAADAWTNLGFVLHALKRDQEALDSFNKALALNPNDADAHHHRGNALLTLGRLEDALAEFGKVLALSPRHADAFLNRGIALGRLDRHQEAVAAFDSALTLSPGHPIVQYNRGLSLFHLGRHADAITAYDRTLAVIPNHVGAWNNRGLALQAGNRHRDAVASYDKAIGLQKDYFDAHFNAALALLTLGDFRRGFAEYEFRWQRTGMPALRRHGRPLWLGEFPLQGRTILLPAEQGLGDTIQFARYVALLARMGAKVVLEVQPELKALLAQLEGAPAVVSRGEPVPSFDVHCPLGSLPLAFKTGPATIPADIPYLAADGGRLDKWRARLAGSDRPRVAIAWSGNAKHVNDRNRSIPLASLAPLWPSGNVRFIGIQRELRSDDAALLAGEAHLTHIGADLDDFADTAAVAALADLVITVDTSVAHLAGAMGRPVWILLPYSPDWRWGLEGETCPWYPSARLFRQHAPGQWDGVIARIVTELGKLAAR